MKITENMDTTYALCHLQKLREQITDLYVDGHTTAYSYHRVLDAVNGTIDAVIMRIPAGA